MHIRVEKYLYSKYLVMFLGIAIYTLFFKPCIRTFLADSAVYSDVYRFSYYIKGLGSLGWAAGTQNHPSSQQLYLPNNLSLNVALAYLLSPSSN